jgi:prepilin-type processing-associated H-X9-DG protein
VGQTNGTGAGPTYAAEIYPYVKNAQLFVCPSATPDSTDETCTNPVIKTVDYFISSKLCGSAPVMTAKVLAPASTVAITEGYAWSYGLSGFAVDPYSFGSVPSYCTANPSYCMVVYDNYPQRHNGGCNLGFVDGHVKWALPALVGMGKTENWDYTSTGVTYSMYFDPAT